MPKAESTRISTRSPPEPHRVALPNTPAAATRSNPIDPTSTANSTKPSSTSKPSDQDGPVESSAPSAGRRASSEAPVSRPHPTVARSTSTGSSGAGATTKASVPAISEKSEPEPVPAAAETTSPIDMSTFGQILELDDGDPEHPFSRDIVEQYFEQFETTAQKMEMYILNQDEDGKQLADPTDADEKSQGLKTRRRELYKLGHFLKGSSAALGVHEVKDTCEKIQHLGDDKQHDLTKPNLSDEDALAQMRDDLFPDVKRQFEVAKKWFIANGYGADGGDA